VGLALALAVGSAAAPLVAEEGVKSLPTLLIKGDVVSLDISDPSATLLKVKDRYGFETPIYVTGETKVTQGQTETAIASLSAGTPVEVEYNFDINTAKRHAVSVNIAAPAAPAEPAPAPTQPSEPMAEPAAPAPTPDTASEPAPTPEPAAQPPVDEAPAPEAPATTQ
jgi:hypothetical protein